MVWLFLKRSFVPMLSFLLYSIFAPKVDIISSSTLEFSKLLRYINIVHLLHTNIKWKETKTSLEHSQILFWHCQVHSLIRSNDVEYWSGFAGNILNIFVNTSLVRRRVNFDQDFRDETGDEWWWPPPLRSHTSHLSHLCNYSAQCNFCF